MYRSIAYALPVLAYEIDPNSNLFQNLYKLEVYDQTNDPSLPYSDDDVLYFYNLVQDSFKSQIDAIDLASGDISDFNDLLDFIRESR